MSERFKKPTTQELIEYFEGEGMDKIMALKCWNHYEAVGWVVGKHQTKMKSWRAAAAGWIIRSKEWNKSSPHKPSYEKRADHDEEIRLIKEVGYPRLKALAEEKKKHHKEFTIAKHIKKALGYE